MKTVFKTTPIPLADIQNLELWLEEQAGKGLFPVWVNSEFTQFRRDEGIRGARFRLEASNGREAPEPERLELCQQAGWSYGDTVGKVWFLFYTTDPDTPELHTDPVTRGLSLEQLAEQVRQARKKARVPRLFLLGLLIVGTVLVWHTDARRLPLFILELLGFPLILLLLLFWFWWDTERELRRLLDFQRSLELGITPKPSRPGGWTPRSIPFWISIPLGGLLIVLWFAYLFGFRSFPAAKPLEDFSRPYVNLQQLESEPLLTYEELFGEAPRREQNGCFVTRSFSLLSPTCYTVEQNLFSQEAGNQINTFSPEDSPEYRYSPGLTATYFRLIIPPLARSIARSRLAELEFVNDTWHYEELSYPGLDFVLLGRSGRDGVWQLAAVGKDGHIAALRYGGREDLADHLDVLAAAVQ